MKRRICTVFAAAVLTATGIAYMASNAVSPTNAGAGYGSVTTSTLPDGSVAYVATPAFQAP